MAKFPNLAEFVRRITEGRLKDGQWPCLNCLGKKCRKCGWTGLGKRSSVAKIYQQKLKEYNDKVELRKDENDVLGVVQYVSKNYYDIEYLRRIARFT